MPATSATRTKADQSPVTDADHAAEAVIVAGLRKLTPGLAVVAEEEMAAGHVPKLDGGPFWLVDPLDGTKEFIKRNGEFTVNIALIEAGRPTLGIVLAPAQDDTLWRGDAELGADKSDKGGAFTAITTRARAGRRAWSRCASRSHAIYSDLDIWFRSNDLTVAERIQAGSSLKFCLIAEGKADIYPRFGPTNEWDTAAGQGVLEAAGGEVVTTDGRPLALRQAALLQPALHRPQQRRAMTAQEDCAAIDEAARLIRAGELVAFPTETVYGLGADATNERAVARIFEAKGRPQFNPLISHVLDASEAQRFVRWSETADKLAAKFWPGPLTLVLPRAKDSAIALLTTAGPRHRRHPRAGASDRAGADPRCQVCRSPRRPPTAAAPSARPAPSTSPSRWATRSA